MATALRPSKKGANLETALANLLGSDTVLPEQFFEDARKSSFVSGEKALMLAVLEDGIRVFQGHYMHSRQNPRHEARNAEEWIESQDYNWPYSFGNICEALGIEPSALRKALFDWKKRRIQLLTQGEPAEQKVYRLHLRTHRARAIGH